MKTNNITATKDFEGHHTTVKQGEDLYESVGGVIKDWYGNIVGEKAALKNKIKS